MRCVSLLLIGSVFGGVVALAQTAGAQPISGIYVGAAGGAGFLQNQRIRGYSPSDVPSVAPSSTTMGYQTGWVGLGSIGYAFGNGMRAELEGNIRANNRSFGTPPASVTSQSGRETKDGGMFNVLFDMDIGSPYVFPYIGAGVGYQEARQTYNQTTRGGIAERVAGTKGAFAGQAMIGAGFPIPGVVGLSITTEFRFAGLTGTRTYPGTLTNGGVATPITRTTSGNETYQLLGGLRYAFDVVPPPAPEVAATPAPAPAPEATRSYLVFFDWNRADLSAHARQVIAEAATAAPRVSTTRIDVSGHADSSGPAGINLALSRRRAETVSAELVRLGVARDTISITALGDSRPLKPAGPGAQEQQNRRVEIVYR